MKNRYFEDVEKIYKKEYGEFDNSIFEKKVNQVLRLADKSLEFRMKISTKRELKGKSMKELKFELAKDILIENAIYKNSSFLVNNGVLKEEQNNFDAYQYEKRIEKFVEKYGDKSQKYGRTERTLSQWLERFKSGNIKRKTMNNIIARFKKNEKEYLKQGSS